MAMNFLSVIAKGACIPGQDDTWTSEIPAAMKRRDPRIWHMAYVAAHRLLATTECRPQSIITGTALGALDETKNFLDGVFTDGFGSPRNFIASVHNSMAGKLALDFSIQGPNLTVCDGQNSFASAIALAALLNQKDFPVLVVAVDEYIPLLAEIIPSLSKPCKDYLSDANQECAIALLLDIPTGKDTLQIRSVGPRCFLSGKEKEMLNKLIAELCDNGSFDSIALPETSCSFTKAAQQVWNILFQGKSKRSCVTSYSPSSNSYAAIDVKV